MGGEAWYANILLRAAAAAAHANLEPGGVEGNQ